MRLFIAIQFTEEIKDSLIDTITKLKRHTKQGKFTFKDNLHLTLAFIGETAKVSAIQQAMNAVNVNDFTLKMSGIGKFKRDGGDIYWIGINKNQDLVGLQKQLCQELIDRGFALENREYKPHLTIGREVVVLDDFNVKEFETTISSMQMNVNKISLMKSERIYGKLVYTEIYAKELNGM
ncbi:RNA 2',3'-cyclic phosphodiesterase [Paludicola sp. MB14-C6]|uniref:RNA 2',3'-cyclic phosphodiesterase n=1 Tax=Paludihabitans sp. MB14-C6 TaxID=3070656 RepID=UPI0027DDCE33|nr:RNA 2',3'-cyclic phosphodiesterase [Paludicola sp. MB14-C6]WMJ23872.1 RNA 2',3'-cyclic phosphodiesterase [Paludicola sp. MB14-C6]